MTWRLRLLLAPLSLVLLAGLFYLRGHGQLTPLGLPLGACALGFLLALVEVSVEAVRLRRAGGPPGASR